MKEKSYDLVQSLDGMTFNHSIRVREIATNAERYFDSKDDLLSEAAFVHDVGKNYIPQCIIDKPGRLTELEREVIDLHPYLGYQLLKEVGEPEEICRIVLYHHGIRMPTLSRLMPYEDPYIYDLAKKLHTIDEFEALTTDRPYRRGFSTEETLHIMEKEEGIDADILNFLRETEST